MNAKPLQVWLVDDDASIRWVLEKALKGSGMAAKCFDQADNVLMALRSDAPDVLMTDIRMPGRSGLDLLKEIQVSRPGLPVIVMTAHSDLDAAVAAYQGGAFEYLPKPFDIDKAVDLVRRAAQQATVSHRRRGRTAQHSGAAGPGGGHAASVPRGRPAVPLQHDGVDHRRIGHRQGTRGARLCIATARAPARPLSRSIPRPSRRICWNRNCSATRRAPSPAPMRCAADASSRRTAAHCSSMKSATCPRRCRRGCCACWPRASSIASAVKRR